MSVRSFSDEIAAAVAVALDCACPFALYSRPESDGHVFLANPSWPSGYAATAGGDVVVQPFDASAPAVRIVAECDAASLLELAASGTLPHLPSDDDKAPQATCRDGYLRGLSDVIAALRRGDGGKVVISRVLVADAARLDVTALADAVFAAFPRAFRFLYFTPATGLWIGASPELLLRRRGDVLHTMALAGTRPAGSAGAWDAKNIAEHRLVVDFIADALRGCGLDPVVGPTHTLPYSAAVEHLCTDVAAEGGGDAFDSVLRALHPTPALCGYPRGFAADVIARTEAHDRGCYGGYIALGDTEAYVNLRCARIYPDGSCCLFAGGGIMPDSDPAAEWEESGRKASSLLSLIEQCRH